MTSILGNWTAEGAIHKTLCQIPRITNEKQHDMKPELKTLRTVWLGEIGYHDARQIQESVFEEVSNGAQDTLLLLEHRHVFTLGRRGKRSDVLASDATLKELGVDIAQADRGGHVTYHGKGQLVGYPIANIRSDNLGPVAWVRLLEETVIMTLAAYGVRGHRVVGKTGVFVGGEPGKNPGKGRPPLGRKIAAFGLRVSGGISMHGFALNVSPDLEMFSHIVPCSMPGLHVTSVLAETSSEPQVEEVGWKTASILSDILGRREIKLRGDDFKFPMSARAG